MKQDRGTWRKIWKLMTHTNSCLQREMSSKKRAILECVQSSFAFNRCLRQGTSKLTDCGKRWPRSSWPVSMKIGQEKEASSWTSNVKRHIKYVASCGPTISGSWSYSRSNLEQVPRVLNDESGKWKLVPKLASLW